MPAIASQMSLFMMKNFFLQKVRSEKKVVDKRRLTKHRLVFNRTNNGTTQQYTNKQQNHTTVHKVFSLRVELLNISVKLSIVNNGAFFRSHYNQLGIFVFIPHYTLSLDEQQT